MTLAADDPAAAELLQAIRSGDVAALARLLDDRPELASARIAGRHGTTRTPLHLVTDWPGYFPAGPQVAALLIESGADPSAPLAGGRFPETPLHWAASTDDVDVAAVLIDGGADLDAPGGSIGTPLINAVGYGCWHVARLLASRGALIDGLWVPAALGMLPLLAERFARTPAPTGEEITEAFWQACHGGQRRAAAYLLARGASVDATQDHSDQTALGIAGSMDTRRDLLVTWLREQGARPADPADSADPAEA
jgi:uncharacterized protein